MKYATKSLTVDAMQYLADENWPAFQKFMEVSGMDSPPVVLSIRTRSGSIKLTPRDWVIRDEHGDFWPMTQSAFNAIFTDANEIHPVNRGAQPDVVTATEIEILRKDLNKELWPDTELPFQDDPRTNENLQSQPPDQDLEQRQLQAEGQRLQVESEVGEDEEVLTAEQILK